jgi:hypothetical protein
VVRWNIVVIDFDFVKSRIWIKDGVAGIMVSRSRDCLWWVSTSATDTNTRQGGQAFAAALANFAFPKSEPICAKLGGRLGIAKLVNFFNLVEFTMAVP